MRTANTQYEIIPEEDFVYKGEIFDGEASSSIEGICRNINYLYNEYSYPICHLMFRNSTNETGYYTASTASLSANWYDDPFCIRHRVIPDLSNIVVSAFYRVGSANDGEMRISNNLNTTTFDLNSTTVAITSSIIAFDNTVDITANQYERLSFNIRSQAGGGIRLKGITAYFSKSVGDISANVKTSGFVPLDSLAYSANDPLSIDLCNSVEEDLYTLYKYRNPNLFCACYGTPSWNDSVNVLNTKTNFQTQVVTGSEDMKLIMRIPLDIPPETYTIQIHSNTCVTAGGTGSIGFRTRTQKEGTSVAITEDTWADWRDGWNILTMSVAPSCEFPGEYLDVLMNQTITAKISYLNSISVWCYDKNI